MSYSYTEEELALLKFHNLKPEDLMLEHLPLKVEVWCRDCYGEDPQGCFDGEILVSGEKFWKLGEAIEEVLRFGTTCSFWSGRILDSSQQDIRLQYRDTEEVVEF